MKIIFVVIFVIALFFQVPAQFKYGIEVGFNSSNVKGDDPRKINGTSGIVTGINGQYELLDFLSIGSGLYLSQKGVTQTLFNNIQGIGNYNYIEVPFNLFLTLPIPQSGKSSVFAGFYIARLLSASVTPNNEGQSSAINIDDMISANDYGINFGIRQGFNLSSGMFNIGIKYSLGLASLNKPYNVIKYGESFTSDGNKKFNNSVIAFTVGYTF
jgi:hypothetical protein